MITVAMLLCGMELDLFPLPYLIVHGLGYVWGLISTKEITAGPTRGEGKVSVGPGFEMCSDT